LDHHYIATLHVDDASSYCDLTCHTSTTADKTLTAKHLYENEAATYGIKIKHKHGDNGVFSCTKYKNDCTGQQQTYNFSAPNFHSQNGVAELFICTFTASVPEQCFSKPSVYGLMLSPLPFGL
jgi:hypothetical protein